MTWHRGSFITLALILSITLGSVYAHHCIHDDVSSQQKRVRMEPRPGELKEGTVAGETGAHGEFKVLQTTYEPLRVHVDETFLENDPDRNCLGGAGTRYWRGNGDVGSNVCASPSADNCWATCTSEEALTSDKLAYLRTQLVPPAIEQLGKMLKVIRGADPLTVDQSAITAVGLCGGIPLPSTLATAGVAGADVVLYITARPTRGSTIAYASSCIQIASGRPIVGFINWGSNTLSPVCSEADAKGGCTTERLLSKNIGVAVHEMTHALGFSRSLFSQFGTGGASTSGNSTGSSVLRTRTVTANGQSHEVTEIVTPTVVQVARDHFQCGSITGVPVEDQGSSGTLGSHWEKRMLYDEYMTGTASFTPKFSGFTAALLQDSGWYQADLTQTQTIKYGFHAGCDFALAPTCEGWTVANGFIGYHCQDEQKDVSCSYDRLSRAGCAMRSWSSIDPFYQRMSDPTLGGIEELADYCPLYVPYTDGDCTVAENLRTRTKGEQYAYDSLCYEATLANITEKEVAATQFFGCYRSKCVDKDKLKVKVGLIWYDCPLEGGVIEGISGFHGTITCPPAGLHCHDVTKRVRWPAVTDVTPSSGITDGGTTVTLEGQYFSTYPRVFIGDARCIDIEVERSGRSSRLSCIAGKYTIKTQGASTEKVPVVVVDSKGQAGASVGAFEYKNVGSARRVGVTRYGVVVLTMCALFLLFA